MYPILNNLHSWNRYLLFAALVFVLFRAYSGWFGKKPYEKADKAAGGALLGLTHLQLVLGLLLYAVFSPQTKAAFADMGAAMKNSWLRYFAVEHFLIMLLAVIAIQLGRTLSKKAASDEDKHKKTAIWTTIGVVLILISLAPKGLLFGTAAAAISGQ
jgi:hypothetical protein